MSAQKKRLYWILAAVCFAALLALSGILIRRRRSSKADSTAPSHTISSSDNVKLNDRELEILRLMAQGKTSAQIADEICLSAETVKWYRKKLFTKFDVANAAELIRRVTEEGII